MSEHIEPTDYPRDVIMEMANQVIDQTHTPVELFFKASCPYCATRCTFEEPFKLYEKMICHNCNKEFPVERAGYMLIYRLDR